MVTIVIWLDEDMDLRKDEFNTLTQAQDFIQDVDSVAAYLVSSEELYVEDHTI